MRKAKAKFKWLKRDLEGGILLPSEGFSTIAWFQDDDQNWPQIAWSLVISNITYDNKKNEVLSYVQFLFPENAPDYLLHVGSIFRLYEGKKCIAEGEIVDVSVENVVVHEKGHGDDHKSRNSPKSPRS